MAILNIFETVQYSFQVVIEMNKLIKMVYLEWLFEYLVGIRFKIKFLTIKICCEYLMPIQNGKRIIFLDIYKVFLRSALIFP